MTSTFTSPLLRPGTPEPELRRNRSFASIREAIAQPTPEKGFAKFLAARRPRGPPKEDGGDASQIGIGEGKEVERDGYGAWTSFRMLSTGDGVGVAEDAVDVSEDGHGRLRS